MIGVIANVTPAISNHIGCVKAEPIARAARSVELALPATRVSVVPIKTYETCEPKIGRPILRRLLNSFLNFVNNLSPKKFSVLYHIKVLSK